MRVALSFVAALLLAPAAALASPKVGEAAPDFSLQGADGKTWSLHDQKGKYVVLEWTNNECPFVRKHYGAGNMQAQQKMLTSKGAVWLTIVSSAPGKEGFVDADKANALTKERGASPTAVLLDPTGKVGHAYDAKTTPHMFLIGPDGKVLYMGGIDSVPSTDQDDIGKATQYVEVAFKEASSGRPVTNPTSRPYGCSVKY